MEFPVDLQYEDEDLQEEGYCIGVNNTRNETHDRCIIHIDIDCFYAQVEMILNPLLRDKAVGVRQKNLIVTTNYRARALGVPKSCLVQEGLTKCPQLVLVNGEDLHKYRKFSVKIFELLKRFECPVERLGMDENFLDVTGLMKKYKENSGKVEIIGHCLDHSHETTCVCGCDWRLKITSKIAQEIRDTLLKELSLTCSAGVAHNKQLAKMVGSCHKPNAQTTIFPCDVHSFMLSHNDVRSIPGIGSVLTKTLKGNNITTVQNLQEATLKHLSSFLDSHVASRVRDMSLGIDRSSVKMSTLPKSIGLEDRFKQISTKKECREKLKWLIARISILIHEDGRLPRVVKVIVRDCFKNKDIKKFHKESRQCKVSSNLFKSLLQSPELDARSEKELLDVCTGLLEKMVVTVSFFHLTLMGLAVSDFVSVNDKQCISNFFSQANGKRSIELYSPPQHVESSIVKRPSPLTKSIERFLTAQTTSPVGETKKRELNEDVNYGAKKRKVSEGNIHLNSRKLREQQNMSSLSASISQKSSLSAKSDVSSLNLPKGWDPEVFFNLPIDLREELLRGCTRQPTRSPAAPKKQRKQTISCYFYKE